MKGKLLKKFRGGNIRKEKKGSTPIGERRAALRVEGTEENFPPKLVEKRKD